MREERYGLLDALQHTDEQMIYEAGQPWMEKKELTFWRMGAACVLLVAAIGITGIFHEQAAAAISRFTTYLSKWLINERDLLPYTEVLNQTQTDNGVSMTLKEVVMDANRMLVSVETDVEEGMYKRKVDFEKIWAYIGAVWINGEQIDSLNIIGSQTEKFNQYVMEYSFDGETVPDDMSEVKLLAYLAQTNEDGVHEAVAEFTFSFTATKEQLQAEETVIPLDVDMETDEGIVLHLEELTYTDIGARLKVNCSADPRIWYDEGEIRWYDIPYSLVIEDDQNNVMHYYEVGNYYDEKVLKEIVYESDRGTPPSADARYLKVRLYKQESTPYSEYKDEKQEDEADFVPEFPEQIGEEVRKEIR